MSKGDFEMATLNVEIEYFTCPERLKFAIALGEMVEADGAMLAVWHVYWLSRVNKRPVTVELLKRRVPGLYVDEMITAGLLWPDPEKDGHELRVIFETEMFGWYDQRVEAGRKAGLKSAKARSRSNKTDDSPSHTKTNRNEPEPTGMNSLSLSLSSSLRSEDTLVSKHGAAKPDEAKSLTEQELEQLYKRYPKRGGLNMGKAKGMRALLRKLKRSELPEFTTAVEQVRSQRDSGKIKSDEFVPQWATFANNWREYLPENGDAAHTPFSNDFGF